ncbi:MAG: YgaP-like transmembrane domain [Bacillaceae bacterium]
MKNEQNIHPINAMIRIAIGFTLLAWSIVKLVRRPYASGSYLFVAFIAAMKIGSGIVRYCPFTALYQRCFSLETYNICVSPIKDFLKDAAQMVTDKVEEVTNNDNTEETAEVSPS